MTRFVDTKPALINPNIIASNVAVRSQTWSDAAQVVNASLGAGSVLIASSYIGDTIPAGATFTYRFRSQPTLGNSRLVWQVRCSSPAAQFATFTGTFAAAQLLAVPASTLSNPPVYVFETNTSGSVVEREYTLTIACDPKGAVIVETIALIELPRTALTSAEGGIPVNTQRVGDPISDVTGEGYSAIARSVSNAISSCRRVGVYHYFTRNPIAFTSTTFSNFLATDVPVLLRAIATSGTLRDLSWRVYAQQTTGDNGEFRLSSTKNGTASTILNITVAGGLKWWPDTSGAPTTLQVDCENTSASDGLRTGSFDSILAEGRVSLAARTLTVHGISVWEAP